MGIKQYILLQAQSEVYLGRGLLTSSIRYAAISLFPLLTAFSYRLFAAAGVSSPRPINLAASALRFVAIKRDAMLLLIRFTYFFKSSHGSLHDSKRYIYMLHMRYQQKYPLNYSICTLSAPFPASRNLKHIRNLLHWLILYTSVKNKYHHLSQVLPPSASFCEYILNV